MKESSGHKPPLLKQLVGSRSFKKSFKRKLVFGFLLCKFILRVSVFGLLYATIKTHFPLHCASTQLLFHTDASGTWRH